jgi:hypothetical protein
MLLVRFCQMFAETKMFLSSLVFIAGRLCGFWTAGVPAIRPFTSAAFMASA